MTQEPVYLSAAEAKVVVEVFRESFECDRVEAVALAVNSHHFHWLIRCPDGRPRHWGGRAKGRATRRLMDLGFRTGRVWAVRFKPKPIVDRAHQVEAFWYILNHAQRGAATWRVEKPSR